MNSAKSLTVAKFDGRTEESFALYLVPNKETHIVLDRNIQIFGTGVENVLSTVVKKTKCGRVA